MIQKERAEVKPELCGSVLQMMLSLSLASSSPTCTGNRSDLLPAMRTKLLLRSYRDRTAHSKGHQIPYSRSTPHRIPRAPCGGFRAGPVFHDRDENRIVPPESEVRLSAEFSFSSTLA
ncbi:hypothetical protein L3Q82_019703 [Scortum barcoo]|uniref:Uncharacterized protein n=1 Tax=Scortum barcoo TaxID=214431 RepID=A0ACB8VC97_9TELE|nr:hypothetical protein L3Q82_019703 [Scortum barcoo]